MFDLGPSNHFLGIQVQHKHRGLILSLDKYVHDILNRAKIQGCKPSTTPIDTNSKLSSTAGNPLLDPFLYRSLVGALQYLTFTHPNIAYIFLEVCLFVHSLREQYFSFLKRVLRYLKGAMTHGLHIPPSKSTNLICLL